MKENTEEQIKFQIAQLTELQNLCVKLKKVEHKKKQDDAELLALLKTNYTLTPEQISTIISIVEGNIKDKSTGDDIEKLKNLLDSYCVICNIKKQYKKDENSENDKKEKPIEYDKISARCSIKKSNLNKELKKLKEKNKLSNKDSEESKSE